MREEQRLSTRHLSDYYPTPIPVIETARALLPANIGLTLDPAAGDGRFGDVLGALTCSWPHRWHDFDICPRAPNVQPVDFLTWDDPTLCPNTVITNPPFSLIEPFIERTMALQPDRVLFLARLALLEGQSRYRRIWTRWPPSLVAVLTKRPSFTNNGRTDSAAYAWFGWGNLAVKGLTWIDWGRGG